MRTRLKLTGGKTFILFLVIATMANIWISCGRHIRPASGENSNGQIKLDEPFTNCSIIDFSPLDIRAECLVQDPNDPLKFTTFSTRKLTKSQLSGNSFQLMLPQEGNFVVQVRITGPCTEECCPTCGVGKEGLINWSGRSAIQPSQASIVIVLIEKNDCFCTGC